MTAGLTFAAPTEALRALYRRPDPQPTGPLGQTEEEKNG